MSLITNFRLFAILGLFFALLSVSALPSPDVSEDITVSVFIDDGSSVSSAESSVSSQTNALLPRTYGKSLCYPLTVQLVTFGKPSGTIREKTCYCIVNGALTPASDDDISNAFARGSTEIDQMKMMEYMLTNLHSRASAIKSLKSSIQSTLNSRTPTCAYPTGAIPDSCESCSSSCPAKQKVCGQKCIASTSTCASGAAIKRARTACPDGWSVCQTGLLGLGGKNIGFECINTKEDLESCGGCNSAMDGKKAGVDCSAIRGVDGVACVSGSCQVNSCLRGFKLENNECIRVKASKRSSYTF